MLSYFQSKLLSIKDLLAPFLFLLYRFFQSLLGCWAKFDDCFILLSCLVRVQLNEFWLNHNNVLNIYRDLKIPLTRYYKNTINFFTSSLRRVAQLIQE